MKIYEAIAMLEQMDKTKEVTLVFGESKKTKPSHSNNIETRLVSPAYYEQINRTQVDWVSKRDEIPVYL